MYFTSKHQLILLYILYLENLNIIHSSSKIYIYIEVNTFKYDPKNPSSVVNQYHKCYSQIIQIIIFDIK